MMKILSRKPWIGPSLTGLAMLILGYQEMSEAVRFLFTPLEQYVYYWRCLYILRAESKYEKCPVGLGVAI